MTQVAAASRTRRLPRALRRSAPSRNYGRSTRAGAQLGREIARPDRDARAGEMQRKRGGREGGREGDGEKWKGSSPASRCLSFNRFEEGKGDREGAFLSSFRRPAGGKARADSIRVRPGPLPCTVVTPLAAARHPPSESTPAQGLAGAHSMPGPVPADSDGKGPRRCTGNRAAIGCTARAARLRKTRPGHWSQINRDAWSYYVTRVPGCSDVVTWFRKKKKVFKL